MKPLIQRFRGAAQEFGEMLGKTGIILRVWRDVACFWRWPDFNFGSFSTGVGRTLQVFALFFLLFAFSLPVMLFQNYGMAGTILGLVIGTVCCSYTFGLPAWTPKPFLLVSLEVIQLMEYTPRTLEHIKGAVRGCATGDFRKYFWQLNHKSRDRAYEALRDTTPENRQQLTVSDLEKLVQSKHPGLRQEAIRLLGNTPPTLTDS